MSLKEALGLGSDRKIRYAIVGLGNISQEAMMPGVDHTGNSVMTALVDDDPVKTSKLAEMYKVEHTYTFSQFPQLLASGEIDAIYLALPNWKHAEYAVPALKAGIHVLVEKPMEVTSEACEAMIAAQKDSTAKLMVAYRLHFEPGTIAAIEKVRSGDLGEVHVFNSTFCQVIDAANHRAHSGEAAGTLLDMGPYPINAVRNLFEDEPTEAFAIGTRHPGSGYGDFDDTVSVTLKFPGNRVAQFTVSYYGNKIDAYFVVGDKGTFEMNPGYLYGNPLEMDSIIGQKEYHKSFKNTDHFGGEIKYFSDCILNDQDPEPDGLEGLADVRVIEAIQRSLKSQQWEKVDRVAITRRISADQEQTLRAQSSPEMINTSSPAAGQEKTPKN